MPLRSRQGTCLGTSSFVVDVNGTWRGGESMRAEPVDGTRRRSERLLFVLLAVVIWPFIAVGVVAGWGFLVWMYYMFTGPPGPV
jgi:nitrate reductase NapE